MAEDRIRLLETLVLKGPNFWSYRPCVWMKVDLGGFQEKPTSRLPGFYDRLVGLLPGLQEHHCSEGAPGGYLSRVREDTWLGHVAEHIATNGCCARWKFSSLWDFPISRTAALASFPAA